jgi:hypothetical protein
MGRRCPAGTSTRWKKPHKEHDARLVSQEGVGLCLPGPAAREEDRRTDG